MQTPEEILKSKAEHIHVDIRNYYTTGIGKRVIIQCMQIYAHQTVEAIATSNQTLLDEVNRLNLIIQQYKL